jgi:hypothetical protein
MLMRVSQWKFVLCPPTITITVRTDDRGRLCADLRVLPLRGNLVEQICGIYRLCDPWHMHSVPDK